jgi:very-short-patch-repair endonuclease
MNAAIERDKVLRPLARKVQEAEGWGRFKALRDFYREADKDILAAKPHEWAIEPYTIDWAHIFTPIEFALWCDIRSAGIVLYPQYPVGKYFADFANPVTKCVIECDGAAFHHPEKDAKRDGNMEAMGWCVYRFTGRQLNEPDEILDESGNYIYNPARIAGELARIAECHGLSRRYAL